MSGINKAAVEVPQDLIDHSKSRLAAIAKAHRALGYDDPCKTEIVKATMSGIRRTKGMVRISVQ